MQVNNKIFNKKFRQVNNMIFKIKIFLAVMAFAYVVALGFCDNIVEKYLFLMKSVLILTFIYFLCFILVTVSEHPPGNGGLVQVVTMMILACPVCVLLVLLVTTISAAICAVITFILGTIVISIVIALILWTIVISIVAVSRWK
jgi:hypothetical protein